MASPNVWLAGKAIFPFRTALKADYVLYGKSQSAHLFPATRIYLSTHQQEESK
jgi:hypothetical protein